MAKTALFVYGTLKQGQSNNHRLSGQEFVRHAQTIPLYRLHGLGWHPGMVVDKHAGLSVHGEVWLVDEQALGRLDEFEGVPHRFRREFVALADYTGDVQAYFFNGPPPADAPTGAIWPFPA